MSSQPSYPPLRPNLTGIAAACILSGGLITAAIINSHRPPESANSRGYSAAEFSKRLPPFSKESISAQVRAQLLASPQLKGVKPVDGGAGFPSSEVERAVVII